jgi:predicted transcriptional regulator
MQVPISINQNSTIYQAAEEILNRNISGIAIKTRIWYGILSQKDIAMALLTEARNIKNIPVSEKMQELLLVDQFAPISNCAGLMLAKKINALGIKDNHGMRGILTKHDLVKFFQENIVDETKLSEIMSVGCFFVQHTATLADALTKMLDNQVSRLLVKDENDKPIGVVTFKSFLKNALHYSNRYENNVFSTGFGKICKVSEITKKQIISVSVNTGLTRVAKILTDYRIHGVTVTKNQKIIGFVTEKDIIRQLARIQL